MSTSEGTSHPKLRAHIGIFCEVFTPCALLKQRRSHGIGVPAYTRWVNRRVARYFAAAAVALGITPTASPLFPPHVPQQASSF